MNDFEVLALTAVALTAAAGLVFGLRAEARHRRGDSDQAVRDLHMLGIRSIKPRTERERLAQHIALLSAAAGIETPSAIEEEGNSES